MKNRLIILFIFILGLIMPISSFKALQDIPASNIDQFIYYKLDNNSAVCSELIKSTAGDLPTFGWNSSQDTFVVGTTTRINGFNFNSNQEFYFKINFYISDKSVFLKDQLEYSYGALNTFFSIYVIDGNTTYWENGITDFTKSYSYKVVGDGVEITQTIRFKTTIAGTGIRFSWGDCNNYYNTMSLNNIYGKLYQFGVNSVQYETISTDNNVIIDQNNTIIDQNQQIINGQLQTNDKIDEVNQSIENNLNSCRDSTNLFNAKLIPSSTKIEVNEDGSKITMPLFTAGNGSKNTTKTLRELAPAIKAGDTIFLKFKTNSLYNSFIYLSINDVIWYTNKSMVITEDMLNSNVYLYGNRFITGETEQVIISDFRMVLGESDKPFEPYGVKVCKNKIDETNDKLSDLNDTLNNDDVDGATNEAGSFFENFTTDTFGLTSVITSPLNLIQSLSSKSCTPLSLQIPFVGGNFTLPCMSQIYSRHFGSFLDIYQIITFGIVSYYVCIRIFNLVKDFKNPEHDEIEVMDL